VGIAGFSVVINVLTALLMALDPMNSAPQPVSSPCIVDRGILVSKRDVYRVLADLGYVRYADLLDGRVIREGEGYVMEVYEDPQAATIVVNRTLYLNICSFDYLKFDVVEDEKAEPARFRSVLELVQEHRVLRLIPMSDPLSDRIQVLADNRALKEAVADALNWDSAYLGDDGPH
jgi:hypothetical protein